MKKLKNEERIKAIGILIISEMSLILRYEGSLRDLNLINWCLKILAISNYNNLNSSSKLLTNNEKRKN